MLTIILLAAATAATSASAETVTPAPVVAAERAFAADGAAYGMKVSFLKHSAPDAIVFAPELVNAHQSLAALPDLNPGEKDGLAWWPLWAGIARSGDLGFTTGPIEVNGQRGPHYFTIWKKQPDGGWKWVYDGGGGGDAKDEAAQGSPPSYLPMSTAQAASPAAAVAEVKAAEAALNARSATDQKALLAWMAADGRIHAPGQPPAKNPAAFETVLAARPTGFLFANLGAESSKAGDLAWTHGTAKWTRNGQDREGYYIRIWQNRAGGWKLVYDQINAKPPAQPAAAAAPAPAPN